MTQYLITTFTDSSGLPHNHVTKARENQMFTVVDAESKEEALDEANYKLNKNDRKQLRKLYKFQNILGDDSND